MLIPVIWSEDQKIGHAKKGSRCKADVTIIPGQFVQPINDGQFTNVISSGSQVYLAAKENRVPEDSDNTLDTIASGENMFVFRADKGQFMTTQFHSSVTSSTVYNTQLGVTVSGLAGTMANAADASRVAALFKEYYSHSGSGESDRILIELIDRTINN